MKNLVFWGKVKKGNARGKKLGFPTANQNLSQKVAEGIYISLVKVNGKKYRAVTFIGNAKTFDEKAYQAETYILDFNKDIYYQWLTVILLKKIRDNKKFTTVEDLIAQMKKDVEETKRYFKVHE